MTNTVTRATLTGITKHYGEGRQRITALTAISLQLNEGELLAVVGPSGSGKSSLLNICGLLDVPCCGHYQLNGVNVAQLNAQQRCLYRRRHIGFIFQHHQLIPAMTVFENIAYPLYLNGLPAKQIKIEVDRLLQKIGLDQRKDHLPKQLSGGEHQRVGIARALIKRPILVVADEPSASLDHKHAGACLQLMRELNREQRASFIIASHDTSIIQQCDRQISLLDGRLVGADE